MTTATHSSYMAALAADDLFVDHTYQRDLDMGRAKKMAAGWDQRLAGALEVSDRGHTQSPRYAVVDGQHRWAAAALTDHATHLVCNVHTGLKVTEEALLFDRLNRERRRITTWDHWHARRAAADPTVRAITKIVTDLELVIDPAPRNGNVRCTATLEKLYSLGGKTLVAQTLRTVHDMWGRELTAYDAPLVHGIGLVHHYLGDSIDHQRLYDALVEVIPRQLKARAAALREITTGSGAKILAIAVMDLYNRRPGKKILVSARTFGPSARNAHSRPC